MEAGRTRTRRQRRPQVRAHHRGNAAPVFGVSPKGSLLRTHEPAALARRPDTPGSARASHGYLVHDRRLPLSTVNRAGQRADCAARKGVFDHPCPEASPVTDSWLDTPEHTGFGRENLPYGVVARGDRVPRLAIA